MVSIFKSPEGEAPSVKVYENVMGRWPVPHEKLDLPTRFGTTYVIAGGPMQAKPIVLLHGQDSSATSWIYTRSVGGCLKRGSKGEEKEGKRARDKKTGGQWIASFRKL